MKQEEKYRLREAVENGDLEKVRGIVSAAGGEVEGLTDIHPLHDAAEHGHLSVVKFLVEETGAPLEVTDSCGWRPLLLAADKGHFPVVEYLVAMGADMGASNKYGWQALHCAAKTGHLPMMEFLLANGVDPAAKTRSGESPHDIASGHPEARELLQKWEDARVFRAVRKRLAALRPPAPSL